MTSLTELRNRDFIRRCMITAQTELDRGHRASTRRIALLTIYNEAGGYYISFDHACMIFSKYRKLSDKELQTKCEDKPAVMRAKQLTLRVKTLMETRHLKLTEAMTKVLVGEHAPRFYFSVDYGMRLLNRYTKQSTVYKPLQAVC
jgi:hypothetical protein